MRRLSAFACALWVGIFLGESASAQQCPSQGDAKQALAKTLNVFKNREDAPPAAKINAAATLPAILAAGSDLDRWSREDAAVFEGVVIDVKVGGVETVNCHATAPADRDTHIELALDSSAVETQRVIVEVTPRWRTKMQAQGVDWSTNALRASLIGRRVRITGWMLDDLEHVPQAENTNPHGATNWRATVWEIHPITDIQILADQQGAALPAAAAPSTLVAASLPHRLSHRQNHKCSDGAVWVAKQHACAWRLPTGALEDR